MASTPLPSCPRGVHPAVVLPPYAEAPGSTGTCQGGTETATDVGDRLAEVWARPTGRDAAAYVAAVRTGRTEASR